MSIHPCQKRGGTTENTRKCFTIVRIIIGDSPIPAVSTEEPRQSGRKKRLDQPPDRDHKESPDRPISQHHKLLIRMDRWVRQSALRYIRHRRSRSLSEGRARLRSHRTVIADQWSIEFSESRTIKEFHKYYVHTEKLKTKGHATKRHYNHLQRTGVYVVNTEGGNNSDTHITRRESHRV